MSDAPARNRHPQVAHPHFATAGVLLEALAGRDFRQLATAFEDGATMSALLPRGFVEWTGAEEVCGAFATWFADPTGFEVVDASVGHVGTLLELRWRLRVAGGRFGDASMVVEQHAFASTGPAGRIDHVALLCSGFWPE